MTDDSQVIKTVNEYLEKINGFKYGFTEDFKKSTNRKFPNLKFNPNELMFFYRGQASTKWDITPNVMRDVIEPGNEANIYNDAVATAPDEFPASNTTISNLIKMQHFGIPTRLLDISQSPLVALYFACQKNEHAYGKETDGFVYVFITLRRYFYSEDDYRVSLKSNLARIRYNNPDISKSIESSFDKKVIEALQKLNKYAQFKPHLIKLLSMEDIHEKSEYNNSYREDFDKLSIEYEKEYERIKNEHDSYISSSQKEIEELQKNTFNPEKIKNLIDRSNKITDFINNVRRIDYKMMMAIFWELRSFASREFPWLAHMDAMDIRDEILSVSFVQPRMDNKRLQAQKGAFLLSGLNFQLKEKDIALFPEHKPINLSQYIGHLSTNEQEMLIDKKESPEDFIYATKIMIDHDSKKDILIELKENFDISEATLFPDLDHLGEELKKRYAANPEPSQES
ncbi:FRG domain-containing protein [Formicincola oecophyllae]|uniref:FRG domain-containing protein n=1 Tax=Formicincola oecophyllae TaxID=2558361 RepID=A0A4Y6UCD4_9PROT|nr:FRG domain-containing protein [Formicincola oecophyllae]QDH14051.1 FRG domain-containing protein [Formicincola oecophyllae]